MMTRSHADPATRTRAPGSWPRFLTALAALIAVAVGLPAALMVVARLTVESWHPIPGVGSAAEIRGWFDRSLSSTELAPVAMRVLLIVAWLLWLGLVLSVMSALTAAQPSLERMRLPRLVMFDGIGAWIAAGITTVSSFAPNLSHPAQAALPTPIVATPITATDHTPPTMASPVSPLPTQVGWERVQLGESIEMFAARSLGDASRWTEIWERNQGRVMDDTGTTWSEPWRLTGGWQLELPPGAPVLPTPVTDLRLVRSPSSDDADEATETAPATKQTPGRWTVETGDSYWRIAQADVTARWGRPPTPAEVAARVHTLIEANAARLGYGDRRMLHVGDVVELPTMSVGVSAEASIDDASGHVVVAGESYWKIAESQLNEEQDDTVSPAEVVARTKALMELNAPRLGYENPAMLRPGDVVQPVIDAAPAPLPQATNEPPGEPAAEPEPEATVPTAAPGILPAPYPSGPAATDTPPPRPVPETSAGIEDTGAEVAADQSSSADTGQEPRMVMAGLTALAAAGAAVGLRRRRARAVQRLRPHERSTPLPEPAAAAAHGLLARDVSDVTFMGLELRWLAHHVPPAARDDLIIELVQLTGERALEVAFAKPPTAPPPTGWLAAADRVWRLELPHSDEDLAAVAEMPPVAPALVTLGDAEGGQLYLNVEAQSGVVVVGDPATAAAWVGNVVWEIAGAALAERPDVIVVGVDVAGVDQFPDVRVLSEDEALALLASDDTAPDSRRGMLSRRTEIWESWPPTVVVTGGDVAAPQWAAMAQRPGMAVVTLNPQLCPDGLVVEADAGLLHVPAWNLTAPAELLNTAAAPLLDELYASIESDPIPDDEAAIPTPDISIPAAAIGDDDGWEPPTARVVVRLLGEPDAILDGERLALAPQPLSALAFLALERNVSVTALRDALWGDVEVPAHRWRDLLSNIRTKIAAAAGARLDVLGHVVDNRASAGDDVTTDLAVFTALANRAHARPEEAELRLGQMLDLVRGRPFTLAVTSAHLWPWVDLGHLEATWSHRVSTAAYELARARLGRGDATSAREIAERGLRADPLSAELTEVLMEAYAAQNALAAAQRVYAAHDRALSARDLGGASPETRRVLERIQAGATAETLDAAVGT